MREFTRAQGIHLVESLIGERSGPGKYCTYLIYVPRAFRHQPCWSVLSVCFLFCLAVWDLDKDSHTSLLSGS